MSPATSPVIVNGCAIKQTRTCWQADCDTHQICKANKGIPLFVSVQVCVTQKIGILLLKLVHANLGDH